MIPTKFEYRSPHDIQEAVKLYREFEGDALYLSGGTDLLPRIKLGLEKPRAVIDLKRIVPLTTIEDQGDRIRIGSLVRIFTLKEDSLVSSHFPALKESLDATSCETLQMRGTIGGNLLQNTRCLFYNQTEFWRKSKGFCRKMGGETCNAVPGAKVCFANYCSDNAPALCTLSAEVEISGPGGERRLLLDRIYSNNAQEPFDLQQGEILTAIVIPKATTRGGYEKLRIRGSVDYPLLGVAFSSANGTSKLAIGAVGPRPYVMEIEHASQDTLTGTIGSLLKEVRPVGNTVVDPAYRKRMIPMLAGRLVKKVMEEAN
jgi:4-hydroxybenzoyl-CoA reductase subunit beta